MAEYHVGCGITAIYAGTLNKKGNMWLHKSDVTKQVSAKDGTVYLTHSANVILRTK